MIDEAEDSVFNPGKTEWIQQKGAQSLDKDQKALLLALAQLEAETGRDFSEEEKEALDSLAHELQGFDPREIKAAIHQMVTQPADPDRKVSWPDIKKSDTSRPK